MPQAHQQALEPDGVAFFVSAHAVSSGTSVAGGFAVFGGTPTQNGGQNPKNKHRYTSDDDNKESFTGAIRNDELFSRGAFLMRQSCHSALFRSGSAVLCFGVSLTGGLGAGVGLRLTNRSLVGRVSHFS